MALASIAYLEGFYYKPRIDFEILQKYSEGLIALSSCLKGEVPETFLNKGEKEAEKVLEKYLNVFKEDFYLELMDNSIVEQDKVNEFLIHLGKKFSVGLVATNDCHYLDKDSEL
jgi:DNA polymerase-3 subunit alpha